MPDILPSNIKTVAIRVRSRGKYLTATVTLPPDLIKRNNLKDGENIVLCYLGRDDENPEDAQKTVKRQDQQE